MNRPVREPSSEGDADPSLGLLVDELTRKLQAGEPIDLEAYLAAHPRHAEALRQLLPALEGLAGLASSLSQGPGARPEIGLDKDPGSRRLGDFRLIREVGRGGMGVVYEAEQVSLRRRVALKTLPFAAVVDPKHLQRFQVEAQAAALLHHTNIVPVYSIGCERGVHYYAMQFIDGQPLSELIKELRRLDGLDPSPPAPAEAASFVLAETLASGRLAPSPFPEPTATAPRPPSSPDTAPGRPSTAPRSGDPAITPGGSTRSRAYARSVAWLGQQAAEALEHAHQQGVLHRDIKPGNLLLDARAMLWVADFGLARFQDEASLTMTGDLLGTLRYMSPEQAQARRVVIDHRTDVYSLGVTLYELLALRPAIDGGERGQILRRIAEVEPTPLHRLNPAVPRDLETIVAKAMAKEAADRYATAQELADDLKRFRDGQTIRARRPSLLDRANKWARRHSAAVATAVGVLVLAVIGLAVSNRLVWLERQDAMRQKVLAEEHFLLAKQQQAQAEENHLRAQQESDRAENERAIAEAINHFFLNRMLIQAAPDNEPDRDILLRTALDRASESINHSFDGPAVMEAAIHQSVGIMYWKLGLFDQAQRHQERAVELRRQALGPEHPDTLKSLFTLGVLYKSQGRFSEAESLLVQALEGQRAALGPEHSDMLETLNSLGGLYQLQGRFSEAEQLLVQALEGRRLALGDDHPNTLRMMNNLAMFYKSLSRLSEAEPLLEQALEGMRNTQGEDHPNTLSTMTNLGLLYVSQGRLLEAESLLLQGLEGSRRVLGADHPETLTSLSNLAGLYELQGRFSEAEPLLVHAVEARRRVHGADHPGTLISMLGLASLYQSQNRLLEAEPLLVETLEHARRVYGPEHPNTLKALSGLAQLYGAQDQLSKAEALCEEVQEGYRRALGDEHPSTLTSIHSLAVILRRQGRYAEAEPLFEQVLAAKRATLGDEHPSTLDTMNSLMVLYSRQGRRTEAEALSLQILDIRRRVQGEEHPDTLMAQLNHAGLYEDRGRHAEAEALLAQTLEAQRRVLGTDHPSTLPALTGLSHLYRDQGRWPEAESICLQMLPIMRTAHGDGHPMITECLWVLGLAQLQQEKYAEAEPALRESLEIREATMADDWRVFNARSLLGGSLAGQGMDAEAEPLLLSGYKGMKAREQDIPEPGKHRLAEAAERLARFYEGRCEPDQATHWCETYKQEQARSQAESAP